MANYDFETMPDRRGRDAMAVDCIGKKLFRIEPDAGKGEFAGKEIPMWVADMNFATSPAITRALQERIAHPLYGYFVPSEEYYQSIVDWQRRHHGYGEDLTREQIGYENGVHGCVMTSIALYTQPGDAVLLHSPAYVGFLSDLRQAGRRAELSPMYRDAEGIWRMDFEDMDRRIKDQQIRLVIFCSPHNPTGRVWERWELERAMEVFADNNCIVVSDEIWCDLTYPEHDHIPLSLVSEEARERTISLYAPSKTFNLAGLIGSYHIIWNPELRRQVRKYSAHTHYNEMNVLSMHALIGAYSPESDAWLTQLLKVLEKNCRYAVDRIERQFDGCSAAMPQGTYMVFMNCKDYCRKTGHTLDEVLQAGWDAGVAYQDGRDFADDWSIRINCALPFSKVQEAFDRLERYVFR